MSDHFSNYLKQQEPDYLDRFVTGLVCSVLYGGMGAAGIEMGYTHEESLVRHIVVVVFGWGGSLVAIYCLLASIVDLIRYFMRPNNRSAPKPNETDRQKPAANAGTANRSTSSPGSRPTSGSGPTQPQNIGGTGARIFTPPRS